MDIPHLVGIDAGGGAKGGVMVEGDRGDYPNLYMESSHVTNMA
jgi:hypothetical protein